MAIFGNDMDSKNRLEILTIPNLETIYSVQVNRGVKLFEKTATEENSILLVEPEQILDSSG